MIKKQQCSYNAIVEYTLEQAVQLAAQSPRNQKIGRRGIAGFCQLQGPTGLGKSSALYRPGFADNTSPVLEQIKNINRQAILVTHRWNILHDIFDSTMNSTDSKGNPFTASVLYSQSENVISAVRQTPLPHEIGLQSSDMPNPFDSLNYLEKQGILIGNTIFEQLNKVCREIILSSKALDLKNTRYQYINLEKETLRKACASLESILLKNMSALNKGAGLFHCRRGKIKSTRFASFVSVGLSD